MAVLMLTKKKKEEKEKEQAERRRLGLDHWFLSLLMVFSFASWITVRPKPDLKKIEEAQALARSRMLRANGRFLTPEVQTPQKKERKRKRKRKKEC
jgi:hypothetical protein